MKREAILHSKLKRLQRRLDIPLWQAVGLLESLWHLTAREAPRGDIGKLSDEDVALAIDYRGDEVQMIEALVYAGWLDRHSTERLVVHDWAEHADDAVQMRLARGRLFFADGRAPKLTRLTGKERDCAHEFYKCAQPAHAVRSNPTDSDSVRTPCAQNDELCAPPEPVTRASNREPEPEPVTRASNREPEPEPEAARAQSAPRAMVRQIQSPVRKPGEGITPETFENFQRHYTESGKPLNEQDWMKASMEAVMLNLSESDMVDLVIPSLLAELPEWADREVRMIPYPGSWLKSEPWKRMAKPRKAPPSKEEQRQRDIDRQWLEVANGTR